MNENFLDNIDLVFDELNKLEVDSAILNLTPLFMHIHTTAKALDIIHITPGVLGRLYARMAKFVRDGVLYSKVFTNVGWELVCKKQKPQGQDKMFAANLAYELKQYVDSQKFPKASERLTKNYYDWLRQTDFTQPVAIDFEPYRSEWLADTAVFFRELGQR